MDWKNIITRALWTLVQGFAGFIAATEVAPVDLAGVKQVVIAAGAAALAAIMSFAKTLIMEFLTAKTSEPV